ALCDYEPQPAFVEQKYCVVGNKQLEEVAELINKSQRPVVYYGGGVVSSGGSEVLKSLIKRADIPSCNSIMGTGVLPYNENLNIGMVGMHGNVLANKAIHNADLLIAIGTRFSDRVALNTNKFAPNAKIVHIDIDPSEINKNVMIDYSIVGDVKLVLERMLPMINEANHREWLNTINTWKPTDYKPVDSNTVLHPHQILGAISDMVGDDAVFVTDVGQHQMWAAQFCKCSKPRSFLTSGGLGTMGFGYGAAIGAKIGVGDRPVIHITGDGSFHMNLNEAPTVVSYNIPIITVIMNNSVLGMVRQWQSTFYGKRYSYTSPERKTDFVKLADAFGLKGYRAHNMAEFTEAFKLAMAANGPVWIECIIDKDEKVLPMIPSGGSVDDIIVE
ncbi:MAG: thiamine pyrophosphate-dependent enzyme, partial [Oscillospiraceae bacterium]